MPLIWVIAFVLFFFGLANYDVPPKALLMAPLILLLLGRYLYYRRITTFTIKSATKGWVEQEDVGKTYDVAFYAPLDPVREVKESPRHFLKRKRGPFKADAAAFVAWTAQNRPKGTYVSVPAEVCDSGNGDQCHVLVYEAGKLSIYPVPEWTQCQWDGYDLDDDDGCCPQTSMGLIYVAFREWPRRDAPHWAYGP